MITNIDLIGFDLAPAAVWHRKNDGEIMPAISQSTSPQLGDLESKLNTNVRMLEEQFSKKDVSLALGFFPTNAYSVFLNRPMKIIGKSTLWFNLQSSIDNPETTKNINEAISPTALITSQYANTIEKGVTTGHEINLHWLPEEFCSRKTARSITIQGLVRELARAYLMELSMNSLFPNGENAIIEFGKYIEKQHLPPISHYSATYWRNNRLLLNKILDGESAAKNQVPLHVEMAETIAAYLLGFSFCEPFETGVFSQIGRKGLSLQPLADRPQIKEYIRDLLHAKSNKK